MDRAPYRTSAARARSVAPATVERREYKYLIDEETAHRLRDAVAPFCRPDAYAKRQNSGAYTISSVYYDTPALDLYHANVRELVDRFKLRVRTYPGHPKGPAFLEVKRRVSDVINKTRGALPKTVLGSLLELSAKDLPRLAGDGHAAAVERFLSLVHTYQARPRLVVRYEREAWVSLVDSYARVTFDRDVRCQPAQDLVSAPKPRQWRNNDDALSQQHGLRGSKVILELKFTSAAPSWMMHIVQSFDLFRAAFSKYGTSVATWFSEPQLSPRLLPRTMR